MRLTPQERDRLLIASAAALAHRRLARGVLLNLPEAEAVICDAVIECARDGGRHADAVAAGRAALRADQVLPGVVAALGVVRVEAVFDDGSRLVVIDKPFTADASGQAALVDRPGEVIPAAGELRAAAGERVRITVENTSEVPITVTSHWHFFEANPRLRFPRAHAYGRRLAVAAGDSVRFDPGCSVDVELVEFGGARMVVGFAGLLDGPLDDPATRTEALRRAIAWGYLGAEEG